MDFIISDSDWAEFSQFSKKNNEVFKKKLEKFLFLLFEENKKLNLTAIRDPQSAIWKHLYDSLLLTNHESLGVCLDWGTGGGLPGVPLAIWRALVSGDKQGVILLDSIKKKAEATARIVSALELSNAGVVCERGEVFLKENRIDSVVMRAVAPPEKAIPWLSRRVQAWVLMLGPENIKAWLASEKKIKAKGLYIENIFSYSLPREAGERRILVLKA